MARSGAVVALSLALMLAILESGTCIKCYVCDTQRDPKCKDPFMATQSSLDCKDVNNDQYKGIGNFASLLYNNLFSASKYCHKIVFDDGNVIRTCLDSNPLLKNQTCMTLSMPLQLINDPNLKSKKTVKHCSMCETDNCNGASSLTSSITLAFITLLACLSYFKL